MRWCVGSMMPRDQYTLSGVNSRFSPGLLQGGAGRCNVAWAQAKNAHGITQGKGDGEGRCRSVWILQMHGLGYANPCSVGAPTTIDHHCSKTAGRWCRQCSDQGVSRQGQAKAEPPCFFKAITTMLNTLPRQQVFWGRSHTHQSKGKGKCTTPTVTQISHIV